jgi:methyl-accepting chemotaxis protein
VVASEVKSLANQTQNAAAIITERAENIRAAIAEVNLGQNDMFGAIAGIDELTAAVAGAVTDQADVSRSIAHNVAQARRAAADIQGSAEGFNDSADIAAANASEISTLAGALSDQASALRRKFEGFLREIRMADAVA